MTTCLGKCCTFCVTGVTFVTFCQCITTIINLLSFPFGSGFEFGMWYFNFYVPDYCLSFCTYCVFVANGHFLVTSEFFL